MQHPKTYRYQRIVKSKLFIDSHFSGPICLDSIADESFFSKFHFIRLFKETYGKTPHQYLIGVRISKAKLLLHSKMTIAAVCYAVGFESISSFTGLFKKLAGSTPSEYQDALHKTQANIHREPLRYIPGCFAWVEPGKKSNFQEALS